MTSTCKAAGDRVGGKNEGARRKADENSPKASIARESFRVWSGAIGARYAAVDLFGRADCLSDEAIGVYAETVRVYGETIGIDDVEVVVYGATVCVDDGANGVYDEGVGDVRVPVGV